MKYSSKNKPMQCMMTQSTCYKNTSEMEIKGILWHSTGANNPNIKRYVQPDDNAANRDALIEKIGKNPYGNDWNHADREAGLNAWVGKLSDGTVATVQTMPWNYRPWGCGTGSKGSCNDGWIQFEICEDNLDDKDYFNKIYEEACELTAYLCKMFNIDPNKTVTVNGTNIPTILCHADSHSLGFGSNHGDINHWFPKFGKSMETVRTDVSALLMKEESEQSSPSTNTDFKIGDIVEFSGGFHYTNANATSGSIVKASKAKITQIYHDGKHPYHCRAVNDAGNFIGGVYGWVDKNTLSKISATSWTPKVGDIVNYTGSVHYSNANATKGISCKGGQAKITQIYRLGKSKHPYHLVHTGSGCTVYGFVDAGTFTKA